MSDKTTSVKQLDAAEFAAGPRGQYIISQALYVAIKTMSEVPEESREISNIEDMQYILDTLFPNFKEIHQTNNRETLWGSLKVESND